MEYTILVLGLGLSISCFTPDVYCVIFFTTHQLWGYRHISEVMAFMRSILTQLSLAGKRISLGLIPHDQSSISVGIVCMHLQLVLLVSHTSW